MKRWKSHLGSLNKSQWPTLVIQILWYHVSSSNYDESELFPFMQQGSSSVVDLPPSSLAITLGSCHIGSPICLPCQVSESKVSSHFETRCLLSSLSRDLLLKCHKHFNFLNRRNPKLIDIQEGYFKLEFVYSYKNWWI